MISAAQIVMLLVWLGFSVLLFILALIARFYEISSGQRTYYKFYLVPAVLVSVATARYMNTNTWGGDAVADGLLFLGSSTMLGLCVYLYRRMMSGQG